MPAKHRFRYRPRARKGYKKKGIRTNAPYFTSSKWSPQISVIPDRYFALFRYSETFTLNSTSGSIANVRFIGNAPSDPNNSSPGPGRACIGWTEMKSLYERSYTTKCYIKVRVLSANITQPWTVAVCPFAQPVVPATMDEFKSRPRCRSIVVSPGEDQRYISTSCTTKAALGRGYDEDQSILNTAVITLGNPAAAWYFVVAAAPFLTPTETIYLEVSLVYNTVLYQRTFVPPSSNPEGSST